MLGMFRRDSLKADIDRVVRSAVDDVILKFRVDLNKIGDVEAMRREKLKLTEQIETLKLQKERKEEEFSRREREIEHKVGLERNRQEQELTLAKREAEVEAKEGNLSQREEAFTERMEFFRDELDDQKDLLYKVLERLPSAEIIARIGGNGGSDD